MVLEAKRWHEYHLKMMNYYENTARRTFSEDLKKFYLNRVNMHRRAAQDWESKIQKAVGE